MVPFCLNGCRTTRQRLQNLKSRRRRRRFFETILLCVDGSDYSLKAAKTAIQLGARYDARVVALYVDQSSYPPLDATCRQTPREADAFRRDQEDAKERIHASLNTIFCPTGVPYRFRAEVGQPISMIIAAAEQERANLIILGAHGTGSFKRSLTGSVTTGVLQHAPCSVLVVR
jgi:nucleotide-binding universal stress UspA family protein